MEFYTIENRTEAKVIQLSEKYTLIVEVYKTTGWSYSLGLVLDIHGKVLTSVKRNYPQFPYALIESHPSDGHDYLVCGEDYQGQTIVCLTTGEKKSYLPPEACRGSGLCWAGIYPSPNKKVLAVDACYWGGPYDLYLFDFSSPMDLPYPELKRISNLDYNESYEWIDDQTIRCIQEVEIRKSDGVPYEDLSEEEQAFLDDNWNLSEFVKRERVVVV
jgi:hypothetical protein